MMSKQVCYGDQVYIEISDLLPPPSTDTRLLCSNGFLDETVFGVKTHDYRRSCFRNCIFTIRPSLIDSKEDLRALSSLKTELSFLSLSKPNTLGEKCLTREINYKEKQIELAKENLDALNKKILLEMDGQNVHYGDVVLLEHVESGYYLSAESSYHPNNPTLYNLRLRKGTTPACYFKFYSYIAASDRGLMDFESEMKLVSAFLNTAVTMGTIKNTIDGIGLSAEDDDQKDDGQKPNFPADLIRRENILTSFSMASLAIGTALESNDNNRIKLVEYCSREDLMNFAKRKIIKNGDYVRFQIDDFYLTASNTIHRGNFGLVEQKTEGYTHNFINTIFQIVKMNQDQDYPKGVEVQSTPKKIDDDDDTGKYYLRHLVSGHYLSIPKEKLYNSELANSDESSSSSRTPYFYFINTHLNQKSSLTRNARLALKSFLGNDSNGYFYLESEVEKTEIVQVDLNSKFFIGFKNSEDKIKSKLRLIKKSITGNKAVGSFFRVTSVHEDEIKKILEIESYANSIKRFMRVLMNAMRKTGKVTPEIFENELTKVLRYTDKLISLLETHDTQIQILIREFKILDIAGRFLYHFFINPEIKTIIEERTFEIEEVIRLIGNFCSIILSASKNNELNHTYSSQYVRTFILCLVDPSPLNLYCNKQESGRLNDIIVLLLQKILGEKDLDTFGQLVFYEKRIFAKLDEQKDYSIHLLKLMNHYFKNKAPNLENTLRDNFIQKYAGDQERIKHIFPVITLESDQDFKMEFERESYPSTIILSTAPPEVFNYLIWVFKVIASAAKVRSLKFWYIIINYYSQDLCEALLNSPKTPPKLKNSILAVVRAVHSSYNRLPFEKLPPKIQILYSSEKMEEWTEIYNAKIQDAEAMLMGKTEYSIIKLNRAKSSDSLAGVDIIQLSLDLLKDGFNQIQNENLESLQFILQVIKGLLTQEDLSDESISIIHHSLATLIKNLAEELSQKRKGNYYQACIKNLDKIFYLLLEVDKYVVKRAAKESMQHLKEKMLKEHSKQKTSNFAEEGKSLRNALDSTFDEWKSKQRLYQKSSETVYLEDSLMKDLWKIVESEEEEVTNDIIDLIKEKTSFEANVMNQLFECAIIAEEKEIANFDQLTSSLLALNKIERKIRLVTEFDLSEKVNEDTLNDIIENLENIFLIIYDFELHMKDEEDEQGLALGDKTIKDIFLQRFRYSKIKSKHEMPFKYKTNCIKIFYQKVLNILAAHEILVPFIRHLYFKQAFGDVSQEKLKLGFTLVMVIIILFLHKNQVNQYLLSKYSKFITMFYSEEIEKCSIEAIFMFTEMCRENQTLLKLNEDYLFNVVAYDFVDFYAKFDYTKRTPSTINLIRSLPVIFSCHIPKDMFDPAQFMMNTFFEFLKSLNIDNNLSLLSLISQDAADQSTTSMSDMSMMLELTENQKLIETPMSYIILKEFLESQRAFALTEIKERVLVLQSSFTLERVLPFLKNENIEFNFELKRLTLETLENIFFKNLYRNTNIFLDYNHFISFMSVLLIDIYGYLRHKIDNNDEIFDIFKTGYFSQPYCKAYLDKYNQLLAANLDGIVFLQYQSLVSFTKFWKKYIIYILCDFIGNLLHHFKDFMLTTKEKGQKYNSIFEIWFRLVLRIRQLDHDEISRSHLDEALKNAVIHSEYAHRRELVYSTLENTIRRTGSHKVGKSPGKANLNSQTDFILSNLLGDQSKLETSYIEANLSHIVSTLGLNTSVLVRLIDLLTIHETPVRDTLLILKLLRKLIEVENKTESNYNQPIYLWSDVSEAEFNNIHYTQERLVDLGAVRAIFALLYQYQKDMVVIHETLLLCVALLFGGNKVVQDAFYEHFKDDLDNEVLSNFAQILEEILELLRIKESKKTQDAYFRGLQHIFNYLIDHPTSTHTLKEDSITVPEELKEKLALSYHSEVVSKTMTESNDYNLLLIILEFLQTLCEGHYLKFQEFLRDQTLVDHSKSSNIPQFLIHAYHVYYKHINLANVETGVKILDLLIEIQQGESQANSEVLLQKTFINDLCSTLTGFDTNLDLLSRGFDFDSGHPRFMAIKSKALTILKDLVERSDLNNLKIISQCVNLTALVITFKENIIAFHKKKGEYPQKETLTTEDMWDLNLANAYTIYIILKHLSIDDLSDDFSPEIQQVFKQILENGEGMDAELANRYLNQFFKKYTGSVEIFDKRLNKLMRIHFPVSVIYSYIKQDTKIDFANRVDRTNEQTKIADFMDAATELIGQTHVEYNSRHRFLGMNFYNAYSWLRLLTNVFAVMVILFDLFHLEYTENNVQYKSEGDVRIQYGLCCLQCFFAFILSFLWVQTRLGRNLAIKWDEFVRENVKDKGQLSQEIIKKLHGKDPLTEEIGETVLLLKGPYSEEWKKVESFMSNKLTMYNLFFTFKCGAFLWHLAYLAICIASNFHPLFAAFQLFDIVIRSDTVSRIALSVATNISQFMWTLVLLVVTVYVYSLLGMYFFHPRYQSEDGDMCEDAFSCYLGSLNYGLRSGGGISDVLQKIEYNSEEKGTYLIHTLYDLSFFILIITLLLNLIFGMIIDAFGDLRDEKSNNDEDMKNVCFICGLTRSEYERTSDFEVHISEEHNMWKYLAYLIYLGEKSKAFVTELTDIEDYILDRYRKRDYIWIPIGRSLTLEQHFAKEEKEKKSEIDLMKGQMLDVLERVQEQNNEIIKMMKESRSGTADAGATTVTKRRPSIPLTQAHLLKSFMTTRSKII